MSTLYFSIYFLQKTVDPMIDKKKIKYVHPIFAKMQRSHFWQKMRRFCFFFSFNNMQRSYFWQNCIDPSFGKNVGIFFLVKMLRFNFWQKCIDSFLFFSKIYTYYFWQNCIDSIFGKNAVILFLVKNV